MTGKDFEQTFNREWDTLRGKVCSVIEAMGMPHSQERAAINLIKEYTYSCQERIRQIFEEE